MSSFLELQGIAKGFASNPVLRGVDLEVEKGETLALLGPSGSGKTTLLRLVAGFEAPDVGSIRAGGDEVTRLPPAARRFGMVFQHFALFPHLTVGQNVGFGIAEDRGNRAAKGARIEEALELVDLGGFSDRRIDQISGGQQQRVALARALAPGPRVLLLDEPLSNLDPGLRERTRFQIRRTLDRVGITALWVTHEQDEAFEVGDRVALLSAGRIEQVGRPEDLYLKPASRFVAEFVGRSSVLAGRYGGNGDVVLARDQESDMEVTWRGAASESWSEGRPVVLILRPEFLELVSESVETSLPGRVDDRRYAGAATYYRVALDRGEVLEVIAEVDAARIGDRVGVCQRAATPAGRVFPAADGGN